MTRRRKPLRCGHRDFTETVRLMGFVKTPGPTAVDYTHPDLPGRRFVPIYYFGSLSRIHYRRTLDAFKAALDAVPHDGRSRLPRWQPKAVA